MTIDVQVNEAKTLGILAPVRAIDVHCPNCQTRLAAHGECPNCGLVGMSEEEIRKLDPKVAQGILDRAIARRKAYRPAAKAGAKSQER